MRPIASRLILGLAVVGAATLLVSVMLRGERPSKANADFQPAGTNPLRAVEDTAPGANPDSARSDASQSAKSDPRSTQPSPERPLDPRWRRLSEIQRSGLDAGALTVFVSQRVAEILDARGSWESLQPSETLRLAERLDGNTQFILQNGSKGIRGYGATREEFPILFELQDLANSQDPLSPLRPKAPPEWMPQIHALTQRAISSGQ